MNPLYQALERRKVGLRIPKRCHKSGTCIWTRGTVLAAIDWYRLALNYLGSYVANNGKEQLLTIEVLTKIMKQPRLLRWIMLTKVIGLNIETTAWRTLTTVFSVLSKYGFQPMLITILYTPRVESPAQPKYTPDVCSDTTSEKFSAGKLATV